MLNQIFLGTRDLSVPETHWRELPNYTFPKKGNIVLILPGGMVDNAQHANGCIKRFLMAMSDKLPEKTDVLSVYYNDVGLPSHRLRRLKKEGILTDLKSSIPLNDLPEEADFSMLFNTFFLPILQDEKGQKRLAEEVCDMLNRLLIVTFCYGGFVAYDMAKRFEKKLKALQFLPAEQEKILRSFTTLATSSRFFMQKTKTSVLHIVSYSDKQKELNWHHKNFHAFINSKKKNESEGALTFLNDHEMVLSVNRMLNIEMDDHHFRGYFCDSSPEFQKSKEGEEVTHFITEFVQKYFEYNGEKTFQNLLTYFSNKKYIEQKVNAGYNLVDEYKKYLLTSMKNFIQQEKLVRSKNILKLKELVRKGCEILSFKNKNGDFLIHIAIQNDDYEMVDFLTRQNPFWFQAYNKKKENPVLLALRKRNLQIAKLLWDKLSTVTLPPFESHRILKSIRRDTFKNVLYYIQKTPLAAKLMDFMLDHQGFLPIQKDDFSIIARHMNKVKKKRRHFARLTLNVLEKCFKRGLDETGMTLQESIPIQQQRFIPIRIIKNLEREQF